MIRAAAFLVLLLAGMLLLVLLNAEFAADVRRARRWLGRRLMPAAGGHAGPAREVAASARQGPGPRPENAGPGSDVPAVAGAGTSPEPPPLPGFRMSAQMSTGELQLLDARTEQLMRPVNGRSLGSRPRQQPVPFAELNGRFGSRPGPEVLGRMLSGLRTMDAGPAGQGPYVPGRVYGQAPVARVLEAERLGEAVLP